MASGEEKHMLSFTGTRHRFPHTQQAIDDAQHSIVKLKWPVDQGDTRTQER